MLQKKPTILYEDKELIVCVKPAGTPTQPDRSAAYDLTSQLMNHLAEQDRKTMPYLAVVHRLDRPVGGVMVFAKTKRAAADLSRQVQEHRMTKRYYCVVTAPLGAGAGDKVAQPAENGDSQAAEWQGLTDWLVVDKRTNLSRIVAAGTPDALLAELRWRTLEQAECGSLVEVELLTGRHHQIRVQMSHLAQGLWGDTKYNPAFAGKKGWFDLALFSHELSFTHPGTGKKMHFSAVPVGGAFEEFDHIQRLRER